MSRHSFIASVTGNPRDPVEIELTAAAKFWQVSKNDIMSRNRRSYIVPARWDFWSRLHRRGMSLAEIGRRVGRDHTTIMYGIQQHNGGAE